MITGKTNSIDKTLRRAGVSPHQYLADMKAGHVQPSSAGNGRVKYFTDDQADRYAKFCADRAARQNSEKAAQFVDDSRARDLAEAEELRRRSELLRAKHGG